MSLPNRRRENRAWDGSRKRRSVVQHKFHGERVRTPSGYSVRRSRLKAIPILIAALADHEHGVALRISIVDVLTLKFARGSVEGADLPERFFGGVRSCSQCNRREDSGEVK